MKQLAWDAVAGEPGRVDYTDRLPVPGGWLYRTRVREGVALTFVPNTSTAAEDRARGSEIGLQS